MSDVTVVVTSYKRFDLLARTLRSFFATNDYPVAEIIVIEDSADAGIYAVCDEFPHQPIRVILNTTNIGQIRSVDKAYSEVRTDYIFHIEDDWEFTRPGVISSCKKVLQAEPRAIQALARVDSDMPRYVRSIKTREVDGVRYKRLYPQLHFRWYTFSFNPTLIRTSEYRKLSGGYQSIGHEFALSRYYKTQNRDQCWVLETDVHHIGGHGRTNYPKAKTPLSQTFNSERRLKWTESAKRKFWHFLRILGIDTEHLQRRR